MTDTEPDGEWVPVQTGADVTYVWIGRSEDQPELEDMLQPKGGSRP